MGAEAPEESPNFFDERFDFEEPFDLLESSEQRAAGATETPAETAEPEGKTPRPRRRRRRGGRSGEAKSSRRPSAEAAVAEPDDSRSAQPAAGQSELELAASGNDPIAATETSEAAEKEAELRRSHRRRRGRGKKHRDAEAGSSVAGEAPATRAGAKTVKSREDEGDVLAEEALDLAENDDADAEQPARLGFRGIPTWEEAVGLLIDRNLEARAKRPSAGQSHGRGSRSRDGHGRDKRGRGGKRRPS